MSTGETELSYSSTINVEVLSGTTVSNDTIVVNARCPNCQKWASGSLDLNSSSQQFIYALGPSSGSVVKINTDSLSANLERHSAYAKEPCGCVLQYLTLLVNVLSQKAYTQ
jgi:Cytochrome domain of cellobiose dehydrogenase